MKRKIGIFLIGLFFVVVTASIVLAQGLGVPHQFYGTVTYNDAPAPNGVSIIAKIEGVIVAGTSTSNGEYGYNPLFFVTDPDENRDGKTIVFYVNGINTGQTAVFENGASTELNLAVSGPAIDGGSSGDSGSSSSSSSSSSNSLSSTGEAVNTGSDTNSESSDENQINVGGGITGAAVGAGSSKGILTLLVILVIVLVGILGYFGWKKRSRK